ncbi:MAG: glycosyltransferase family 4 protein [Luteibaculaceae bacterium]
MRFLFLYSELAAYTLACFEALAKRGHSIDVVHWPINPEAPFQFKKEIQGLRFFSRDTLTEKDIVALIETQHYQVTFCSGWLDKGYLNAIKKTKGKGKRVIILDNQWRGDFKQHVAALTAPLWLTKWFHHAWVPGKLQQKFAEKLGFKGDKCSLHFYSADTDLFEKMYQDNLESKVSNYPKRFLFVGRYVDFKGILELWDAFAQVKANPKFSEWELWCVGTGKLYTERKEIEGITHLGFKQPHEMPEIIKQCGIFIMPSRVEPWGVVLHEMVTAGMPVLVSEAVGAKSSFLIEGENGFAVEPNNLQSLVYSLERAANLSPEMLCEMMQKSHAIGLKVTPEKWADLAERFL